MDETFSAAAAATEGTAQNDYQFGLGGYLAPEGSLAGAGFGRRVGAYLIDLALHYVVATVGGLFLGFALGLMSVVTQQPIEVLIARFVHGPAWPAFLAAILGMLAYRSIAEGMHGSTLGKRILGMAVVQEDGTPCRLGSACIRGVAFYIDSLFFGLVGYMHMQKTGMQQRYGDDWAQTVVCRTAEIKPENLRGAGTFVGALALGVLADGVITLFGQALRMI